MVKNKLEGCVFYFFNEYQTKHNKNKKINKIVKNNFFIQNELTNHEKLLQIKNKQNFFYLCENTSQLKLTQIDENNTQIITKHDDTILLQFEDCELVYFKNYLQNIASSKLYILTIINFYKHLLNSLRLLVTNNIFHNHINFDSIVVNTYDYPLLSNFSFSINYSRADIDNYIKHFIIAYEPSYIEWPIELHILSYLLTNKLDSLSNHNIETIITEYIKYNNILNTFGSDIVSSYKEEANKYFKRYINQSYEYILTDILQYSSTWDNYALSILFLRILIGIHRTIEIKNKFIILFMKLLVCNIHLNPLKRLSIENTIIRFNYLLDSLETTDFKQLIHLMSA